MSYTDNEFNESMTLMEGGANAAAWYLYHWLKALAHARETDILDTSFNEMRSGVNTRKGKIPKVQSAYNTLNSSANTLHELGLISVSREGTGNGQRLRIHILGA